LDSFWAFGNPKCVASLGDDLKENFGGDASEVLLAKSAFSCHLANNFILDESSIFEFFVLSLELIGKNHQADVAAFSLSSLSNGLYQHIKTFSIVVCSSLDLDRFKLHLQFFGSLLEGIEKHASVLTRKVYNTAFDAVLTVENRLSKELEECFLSFIDSVMLAKIDLRHGNESSFHCFQIFVDSDSQFLE